MVARKLQRQLRQMLQEHTTAVQGIAAWVMWFGLHQEGQIDEQQVAEAAASNAARAAIAVQGIMLWVM